VEQELPTLPDHLSSHPVFSGIRVTRSLVLYVCFIDRCLSFCTFYLDHCVVCSSLIYGFWLPPFGIFKLFLYNKKTIVISMLNCYCRYFYVKLLLSRTLDVLCFLWHWHHVWRSIRYIHLRSLSRRISWVVGDSFYNTIFEFYTRW
jgi:hypothetical protein